MRCCERFAYNDEHSASTASHVVSVDIKNQSYVRPSSRSKSVQLRIFVINYDSNPAVRGAKCAIRHGFEVASLRFGSEKHVCCDYVVNGDFDPPASAPQGQGIVKFTPRGVRGDNCSSICTWNDSELRCGVYTHQTSLQIRMRSSLEPVMPLFRATLKLKVGSVTRYFFVCLVVFAEGTRCEAIETWCSRPRSLDGGTIGLWNFTEKSLTGTYSRPAAHRRWVQ